MAWLLITGFGSLGVSSSAISLQLQRQEREWKKTKVLEFVRDSSVA